MSVVATAIGVAPGDDNLVPRKVAALFSEFDANKDGVISEGELSTALANAFPEMPTWAKEHLPHQFGKYATGDGDSRGLDEPAFTKVYAAFLFRNFDANGDGALQVDECEAALKFLADGKPTAVAVPEGKDGVVTKLDFWLMFKAMMA